MVRHVWILTLLIASTTLGQQPGEAPQPVDVTKVRIVERPTEELVADLSRRDGLAAAPDQEIKPAPADRTKRAVIEPAAEAIVRGTQPPEAVASDESVAAGAEDNPRVEPGKVKWHDDVAAAVSAAKTSGKPVLVFHLLGELDQRFT